MNSPQSDTVNLPQNKKAPVIGVVGVCASGKSTLIERLSERGYRVRHIAQEHSYVKDMWKRITNPNLLIYLDASFETTCQRRKLDWTRNEYLEQKSRLSNARENADYFLDTTSLSADEVFNFVLKYLEKAIP
jgi:deoxyadenosine/deoxycytidine kinase